MKFIEGHDTNTFTQWVRDATGQIARTGARMPTSQLLAIAGYCASSFTAHACTHTPACPTEEFRIKDRTSHENRIPYLPDLISGNVGPEYAGGIAGV
jgi:hypothetical protein